METGATVAGYRGGLAACASVSFFVAEVADPRAARSVKRCRTRPWRRAPRRTFLRTIFSRLGDQLRKSGFVSIVASRPAIAEEFVKNLLLTPFLF